MEKCDCEKAKDEIDDAWDHPIRYDQGEGGMGCKRLREIMDAEIEYAKACEWCPCRKRLRMEVVLPVNSRKVNEEGADEASGSDFSQESTSDTKNQPECSQVFEGPCECSVAIARMASLLEQDYGTDKPTQVDESHLPTDEQLNAIHEEYFKSRTQCIRCGLGGTLDPERCSCRNACNRRSDYELLSSFNESQVALAEYRAHYAEAEMQWVYDTTRCLACQERMKDCSVIYRTISVPGRIWKIKRRVLKSL